MPETGGDNNHVSLALYVEYPPTYPEVAPMLRARPVLGLTEEQAAECQAMLIEAAQSDELLGTAMIYSLAERAQARLSHSRRLNVHRDSVTAWRRWRRNF